MNRRNFVQALGGTALFQNLVVNDGNSLAARLSDSASLSQNPVAGNNPNPVWNRPTLVPIPREVTWVKPHIVDLCGTWKFSLLPPQDFASNHVDPSSWSEVMVPGELTAQGFAIARDSEYAYKRQIPIPAGAHGHRVLLRFDGVYSYAKVWIDGQFVREHHGGFTSWDCDVTPFVTPGKPAWLTVAVTDRADDVSYGSNYAKHFIGGILRPVRLVVLPSNHLVRLHVEPGFDTDYKDGRLKVFAQAQLGEGGQAQLGLKLKDAEGRPVAFSPESGRMNLSAENPGAMLELEVASPRKWDSERPNLYTLEAELAVAGAVVEKFAKPIGFRQVEWRKNELFVNGDRVKLRGVCRHDVHPVRGRCVTPEIDRQDAELLRDANVNFVRTSHYPPSESFLEACDRVGIYVEEETAVCFVNQPWSVGTPVESNPDYTARFMNQFAEMIERDRSHACVILWSLGNESRWGSNIARERDYLRQEDASRPAIFSYPETAPAGVSACDVYSFHYPKFDADLTSPEVPRLNDECIHIACYEPDLLKRDPGVRNHWGRFLKRFWEDAYPAAGCVGGAIWAGFDEVFLLPDGPIGYGQWGIVDGLRRQKPEFWLTRKAYSPIRIADVEVANPGAGRPLEIPVKNWFNHTHFDGVVAECRVSGASWKAVLPPLAPGEAGILTVAPREWKDGETVELGFRDAGGRIVDQFQIRVGERRVSFPAPQGPTPTVQADTQKLTVQGADFRIVFSKATGLISEGVYRGRKLIEGGPYLNLTPAVLAPWWLTNLSYRNEGAEAVVSVKGAHLVRHGSSPQFSTDWEIRIDGQGLITTRYQINDGVKTADEVGISYLLAGTANEIGWERRAIWSAYPPDHIGRPQGTAQRKSRFAPLAYRQAPRGPWADDEQDFFLFGPKDPGGRGTHDFRSLKENIWYARCGFEGSSHQVWVESDGSAAARVEVTPDGSVRIYVHNLWAYTHLGYGVDVPGITLEPGYQNEIRLRMLGGGR